MKNIIASQKIIPVLTLDNIEDGYFVCRLLQQHGFQYVEVTLRSDNALAVAKAINNEFSDLHVGVGTITTIKKMAQVTDENFAFAVSPGFDHAMVNMADIANLPFLPGITTITEAMNALSLGVKVLKFFPAELNGGVKMLQNFDTILPELTFCPTGGIKQNYIKEYLAQKNVLSVGLSDIAPLDLIKARDTDQLIARMQHYAGLAAEGEKD